MATEVLAMTERNRLRRLQDAFLRLPYVKRWIAAYGEDGPMFGYRTPGAAKLRLFVYPEYQEQIRRSIRQAAEA